MGTAVPTRSHRKGGVVVSANTYLTLKEAAEYAACSVDTLRRRIRAGELVAHRSGRLIRVKRSDLDAMLTPTSRWAS